MPFAATDDDDQDVQQIARPPLKACDRRRLAVKTTKPVGKQTDHAGMRDGVAWVIAERPQIAAEVTCGERYPDYRPCYLILHHVWLQPTLAALMRGSIAT
jgi:hypothetical protein